MSSELQAVCDALVGVIQPLANVVRDLHTRATRLRAAADNVQAVLKNAGGSATTADVAQTLYSAAMATERAAAQLEIAGRAGRAYVERTANGSGAGGGPERANGSDSQPPAFSADGADESRSDGSQLFRFWAQYPQEYVPPSESDWGPVPGSLAANSHPATFASWVNDGGDSVHGRSNNCADCARAVELSWRGHPQVSAARRTGRGENLSRIASWLGGDLIPMTFEEIRENLQFEGPGSSAYVVVTWKNGGGHAFNAVNYRGVIYFVDSQPKGGAVDTWPPTRLSPGYGFDLGDIDTVYGRVIT